jgi:phosphoribosylaminoimidazole carboxylase PurE protein
MANNPLVAVIMGSDSDLPVMEETVAVLKENKVPYTVKIMSAHRTPDDASKFAKLARKNGIKVIIAGAGCAAHLAGVLAAHTTIPVLGVPMESKGLGGMDALLSTVQMPSGIPVGTLAIGKAGAKNAGILAIQILSLNDKRLEKNLDAFKKSMALAVRKKNSQLKLT